MITQQTVVLEPKPRPSSMPLTPQAESRYTPCPMPTHGSCSKTRNPDRWRSCRRTSKTRNCQQAIWESISVRIYRPEGRAGRAAGCDVLSWRRLDSGEQEYP